MRLKSAVVAGAIITFAGSIILIKAATLISRRNVVDALLKEFLYLLENNGNQADPRKK